MRHLTASAVIACLAVSAWPAEPTPAGRPFLVTKRCSVVAADPAARDKAPRVAALVDVAVPRIAGIVGTADLRPIPLIIYTDRTAMLQAAGMPPRSTVVGVAALPSGVIYLDGTERLAGIEKVVPHEVAHVLIARAVGPALPAVPLWLNEGIAEYAAGATASRVDPIWLRAIGQGQSLGIGELDRAISDRGDEAGLAYAQAASIVNFLVAQRGEGVIADLLRAIARSEDFEAALQQVTGWQQSEMESAWRRAASRSWRWPLLFESQLIWFGLMVLLFLAGLVRYLRERRRRQETPGDDW